MKNFCYKLIAVAVVLIASAISSFLPSGVLAQSAVQTPVYIPSVGFPLGTYSATVSSSTPTAAFSIQNQNTMCLQFSGTYTALTAYIQGTVSPPSVLATNAVWSNVATAAYPEDSTRAVLITQNGLYCFSTAGLRQVRVNVTAVTIAGSNSLVINASGSTVEKYPVTRAQRSRTYNAAFSVVSPATAAVDWATIVGSATTQVHVKEIACWGTAGTAYLETISLIKRSTLDTGAVAATPTVVPNDSGIVAGTSVVSTYTTAPSPKGTAVGTLRVIQLYLPLTSAQAPSFDWQFGTGDDQDLILNTATENLALNSAVGTNAQTFNCFMKWEEE